MGTKDWNDTEKGDIKSRDPRNDGNNGNPAQSAGRVSAQEQDQHPDSLERDPLETYPDISHAALAAREGLRGAHDAGDRREGDARNPGPHEGSLEAARSETESNRSPAGENI